MKKAKLGDVFSIKVPNGFKLFQWAYSIPQKGDYIRVFDGLFQSIPNDIDAIVCSPHSYIISFYVSRAYRIGLAQNLGNFPIPERYPFPKFQIRFRLNQETKRVDGIHVMNSDGQRSVWKWFEAASMKDLPEEYQNIRLLNSAPSPNWLLYLFDVGFDLLHPERFFVGTNPESVLQKYSNIVDSFYKNK